MDHKINQTGSYKVRALASYDRFADSNVVTIISLRDRDAILRLEDLIPDPWEFGIFEFMRNEDTEMSTFLNSIIGTEYLDLDDLVPIDEEYIGNKSGLKPVSRLVKTFLLQKWSGGEDLDWYPITVGNWHDLSSIIRGRYLNKWRKLWLSVTADYDPMAPLHLHTVSRLVSDKMKSKSTSKAETSDSGKSFTFGYNDTGVDGRPTGRAIDEGNSSREESYERDLSNERDIQRDGNIGNLTPMQMLSQEREFVTFQLFDAMMNDVDKVLTSRIIL